MVEVVAGTAAYAVRLATTRTPGGEDEAELAPGQAVTLRSLDVDWGETIDGRLEFTARDGSGAAYTDELVEYSFTRPTREDCAALAEPTTPDPAPPTAGAPSPTAAVPPGDAGTAGPAAPSATTGPTPEPGGVAPAERSSVAVGREVGAGGAITLQAGGFLPGERITVQLREGGAVLGTATAGPDGTVQVEVRIPQRTGEGRTTVDLIGADSAVVADVQLQVAGAERAMSGDGWADLVPLTAAAVALVGSAAGLVSVAGGQRIAHWRHAASRSA